MIHAPRKCSFFCELSGANSSTGKRFRNHYRASYFIFGPSSTLSNCQSAIVPEGGSANSRGHAAPPSLTSVATSLAGLVCMNDVLNSKPLHSYAIWAEQTAYTRYCNLPTSDVCCPLVQAVSIRRIRHTRTGVIPGNDVCELWLCPFSHAVTVSGQ